jgi:single-strand DNA-binding protein
MLNKISLIGRCGQEPDVKILQSGSSVAQLRVATSEKFKNKAGEKTEETQWHTCVLWGKLADLAKDYVHKGDQVYLEGILKYEEYEKDGVTRRVSKIHVREMKFLSSKQEPQQQKKRVYTPENDELDQIPF